MTKSAEPSTPSGSSETQQRRRQITSYKNTTTSPATDSLQKTVQGTEQKVIHPPRNLRPLAPQIHVRQIDQFHRATIEHRLDHEQPEILGLIECRFGRHYELLARAHDIDERGAIMTESLLEAGPQILRTLDPYALYAHRLRHRSEVRIL